MPGIDGESDANQDERGPAQGQFLDFGEGRALEPEVSRGHGKDNSDDQSRGEAVRTETIQNEEYNVLQSPGDHYACQGQQPYSGIQPSQAAVERLTLTADRPRATDAVGYSLRTTDTVGG